MILSFKELRKRDVVNIADGRSFGKITDLKLDFPCATLKGIVVCDKKRSGLFGLWCKNEIFIDEKQIVRIGGDVILVNIKNCDAVTPTVVDINTKTDATANSSSGANKNSPSCPPCPPPLPPKILPNGNYPPFVPPPCPKPCPDPCAKNVQSGDFGDVRIDFEDY